MKYDPKYDPLLTKSASARIKMSDELERQHFALSMQFFFKYKKARNQHTAYGISQDKSSD